MNQEFLMQFSELMDEKLNFKLQTLRNELQYVEKEIYQISEILTYLNRIEL